MFRTPWMLGALLMVGLIIFSAASAEKKDTRNLGDTPKEGPIVFKGPLAEEANAVAAFAHWVAS